MNRLRDDLHLGITPAGAYHAAAAREATPDRTLLFGLLRAAWTPRCGDAPWREWLGGTDPERIVEAVTRLEGLGWIWGLDNPEQAPTETLERLLPTLLPDLSSTGQALLADHHGLQIAFSGFDDVQAPAIAAISAEAVSLAFRCRRVLGDLERLGPGAWGMIDAAGHSQLGVWPLFIGDKWFALVIGGRPRLNHPAFSRLLWALVRRLGDGIPPLPAGIGSTGE
jgi:hypothetical protein